MNRTMISQLICIVLCMAVATFTKAQNVGVNTTTPHASAALDVTSTTRGMLVPRMTTAQRDAIVSPAVGLLVYDISLSQFVFYSGSSWNAIPVGPGSSSSWTVNGSDQYSALSGKVGIGVNNPLEKVHIKGNIVLDSSRLFFTNTGQSVFVGENAGKLDDLTNKQNVFVGYGSGEDNTSGTLNTFVGGLAGANNITGSYNTALGQGTLFRANSNDNVAVGHGALLNATSASGNTVIGKGAGLYDTTGSNNVFVGMKAGENAQGSNNVFVGHEAGRNETGSNRLYIANSSTALPLIYGEFDSSKVRINGKLNINNAYTLPASAGSNGYVLQTNGAGDAAWVNANTLSVNYDETDPKIASATNNAVQRWNGTKVVDGAIQDDSSNVGIGTNPVAGNKLTVSGKTKTDSLQIAGGAANGYLLQSDAGGNATWVDPSMIAGSNSWTVNGTNQYSSVAGNVGIGTNTPAGKLHVKGTTVIDSARIVFQNTGGSILIGQNAGANDPFTNTTNNTFIGKNAGAAFTTGTSNIALGSDALQNAGISVNNIAIGTQSFSTAPLIGIGNIGIGEQTGLVNAGNNNLFIGSLAGNNNSTGADNIMIGRSAGTTIAPSTGSRNVFIGLNAGENEMGSDKLYINSSVNPGPPLVFGDFFTRLFRINGILSINGNYALPGTAGNNNFVLKSDGGGNTSWANVNTLVNSTWTASGTNQYASNTGNVGIGTSTPGTKLDVAGTTRTTAFQLPTGATAGHILRSDAGGNATWVNPNTISFTETDPQVAASVTDRIPKWNGTALTDGIIYDNGVNIGISTSTPNTKLDVNGTTKTVGFQMPTGAVAGHILRTDEFGLGTWVNPNTITVNEVDPQVASAAVSKVPRWTGTALADGTIQDDATNVGIGTAPVAANKLTVAGKTQVDSMQTIRFQMTNGATNGYVLQSDAAGRANWVNANTLTVNYTETDPQVTATTANKVPKWNGTSLADGLIYDNGTNIGIGNTAPADKLHITGNLRVDNGRIDFRNTGGSVFAGTDAGLNDDKTSNFNTFIGEGAGKANTNGNTNVAVGHNSLLDAGLGTENVVIGDNALNSSNEPFGNVVIGNQAGYQAGDYNTVMGWQAGGIMQSGSVGNVYIGARAGYNIGGSNKLYIGNHINASLIYGDFSTGTVGIGTTSPTQARLVVNGSLANTFASYGYLNRTHPTGTINGNTTPANYSIYASERIAAAEFNAYSDARIKNIKGISNSKNDLQTLMGIEITDYRLKDSIGKGNKDFKKVIAQQVEKVYPQAVTKMTDVVPDIYKQTEISNGVIHLATSLKKGDKVKLIFESGEEMATVTAVTATSFTVDKNKTGKVFVFGKEVSDFRTVDYEALGTLNISATQELLKRIEQLEKEIKSLKGMAGLANQ